MPCDWERLVAFAIAQTKRDRRHVCAALAPLEPIFRKTDGGRYKLAPAKDVSKDAFITAMRVMAGRSVADVAFVSLSDGPSPLVGEAREAYWQGVIGELSTDLRKILWPLIMPRLRAALGERECRRVEDLVWKTIGEDVWWSLQRGPWEHAGYGLLGVVRAAVMLLLLEVVGCTVAGDDESLMRSRPLVDFIARAMPLGERAGRPGEWVVITA